MDAPSGGLDTPDALGWAEGTLADHLAQRCFAFLRPLLRRLDEHLDRRLVRTVANAVIALVRHRHRPQALWLSELGAYLTDPQHAPAGTKRLSRLVHSPNWAADAVDRYLLERGRAQVAAEAARTPEGRALCILDGSVLEQPESMSADGLCPVRSSKARRLNRPRPKLGPGYSRGAPGGPVVVPGFRWVGVLVTGWAAPAARRPVTLGAWHWYATPPRAEGGAPTEPAAEGAVLRQRASEAQRAALGPVVESWGAERRLHVWDRGLAGAEWLGEALDRHWHFIVRWPKRNRLRPAEAISVRNPAATPHSREEDGVAAAQLTMRLRARAERRLPNPRQPDRPLPIRCAARPVRLLQRDEPLWLVVARLGPAGRRRGAGEPWRLVTTEPAETEHQCWRIIEAYAARWAIAQMLRFGKSALGVESVRVRAWAARHKLLALVALAYAFLVDLLGAADGALVRAILRWAHRTGRQARDAWRSLYRLRAGLAAIWQRHTPAFQGGP